MRAGKGARAALGEVTSEWGWAWHISCRIQVLGIQSITTSSALVMCRR